MRMWKSVVLGLGFSGLAAMSQAFAQEKATDGAQARPVGNPGEWFVSGYPVEAMKARVEGRVGFALDVGSDGKPSQCRVVRPSESTLLNEATCAIAMEKARFEPGVDTRHYSSSVRWTLPPAPAPAPLAPIKLPEVAGSRIGASNVTVNADGIIEKCESLPKPYANVLPPPDICAIYPAGTRFSAPTIRNGHPQRRRVRITISTDETYLK
jgi:TonB family protein